MEEALKFAIILTEKHQAYTAQIAQCNLFKNQKELRKKQTEISSQMIDFLEDLQEVEALLLLDIELKNQYNYLVKYYSKQIYARIHQFQQKIDLLNFENKFVNHLTLQNNFNNEYQSTEIIQKKLNSYYNLIQK